MENFNIIMNNSQGCKVKSSTHKKKLHTEICAYTLFFSVDLLPKMYQIKDNPVITVFLFPVSQTVFAREAVRRCRSG